MNKKTRGANETFRKKCREANLKITPQRMIIFESLIDDKSHPCADTVFQRVRKKAPHISFDTVNRTLLSFVDMGLLKVVEGYGRPKRFDPDTENHHHFQCVKCNKIIDFSDKALDAIEIPEDIKRRFTVTGKKIVIEGLCDSCKR
ncbi:MAG: transcriptional repressor [Candidatus Omnitrophica bacterium]|nr:transcriptional repressor [Candidatus Omnitrophota bacterium]